MTAYDWYGYHCSADEAMMAIRRGNVDEFEYNGKTFSVKNRWSKMVVSNGKHTATALNIFSYTDLQGIAACLEKEQRDLKFDKEGNLIN